jgi:hypothetical protein
MYIENIDLKGDLWMFLYDIYSSGIWQVLTRFAVNLSTCFILSQYVSQNCNVFINRPNITLAYLSFQLSIQDALVSNLTQEASHVD